MRNLSKSEIIAHRQCPKRLWLEIHQPDLRDDSASAMLFQIGNQVGVNRLTIGDQRINPRALTPFRPTILTWSSAEVPPWQRDRRGSS